MEQHRPALFAEIQAASRAGRWEPINGPWVETDCVLVSTASLWNQFAFGQEDSRHRFPEWAHELAWLPDSFGFAAGLPAVAAATGVRWFCTHKLAWNAENPFPHRLFRWRGRGRSELRSLMLPPIGRRADPMEMLGEQRAWHQATGLETALWIPGVGDHGGGPTEELLEEIELWEGQVAALPTRPGTVRAFLTELEQDDQAWPVWRDELFLELHRGCATSRPDQKRHNRTLERLLREADTASALLAITGRDSSNSDWRRCCFSSFTTFFREPRSRRCLTRRNRCGAQPGARPARNAIGAWQGCPFRRTQRRHGVGGGCNPWPPGRLWFAFRRDRGQPRPFPCRSNPLPVVAAGCSCRVSRELALCRSGVNQA